MTTIATEAIRPPAAVVLVHRPWWRGRLVQVAAIVALMYVAYRVWALDYPWPDRLIWNSLSGHLDTFQVWLSDNRNAENPSVLFAPFDGFSTFVDHLVDWFDRLLLWLTWIGTVALG